MIRQELDKVNNFAAVAYSKIESAIRGAHRNICKLVAIDKTRRKYQQECLAHKGDVESFASSLSLEPSCPLSNNAEGKIRSMVGDHSTREPTFSKVTLGEPPGKSTSTTPPFCKSVATDGTVPIYRLESRSAWNSRQQLAEANHPTANDIQNIQLPKQSTSMSWGRPDHRSSVNPNTPESSCQAQIEPSFHESSNASHCGSMSSSSLLTYHPNDSRVTMPESEYQLWWSEEMESLETTLDAQAVEIIHLDMFSRLNYRGFIRLAGLFDKVSL